MDLYKQELKKEGIKSTNAARVATAIDIIHDAMCRMDLVEIAKFKKKSLDQRVCDFSAVEELRNP